MELKKYQQDVINDIDQFIDQLEVDGRLDTAFSNFWEKKAYRWHRWTIRICVRMTTV